MVNVTLSRLHSLSILPLNPHRLRIAAALFALAAAAALLTGCNNDVSETQDGLSGLRGIALATRPSINFPSEPASPQRHARPQPFSVSRSVATLQHRQSGASF